MSLNSKISNQQNKQASKQNITRNIEIKNKVTVTRVDGRITGERRGRVVGGTGIKDPWRKSKGVRIQGGRWGWVGQGKVVAGKWSQLYLNNNCFFFF